MKDQKRTGSITHRGNRVESERNAKIAKLYSTGSYSYNSLARMFKLTPQRIAVIVPQEIKDKVNKLREVQA